MKPLLKLFFTLALIFLTIFVVMNLTETVTLEKIEQWLEQTKNLGQFKLALLIILLLMSDLLLSIPTLALITLSGFLLGPILGGLTGAIGLLLVGVSGYLLGFYKGHAFENIILKNETEKNMAKKQFASHGKLMIIFSRALPMMPEITACLAGITRMQLLTFLLCWLLSILPYAFIAAYVGSISSIDDPTPAIYGAIFLYLTLGSTWYLLQKRSKATVVE